MIHNSTSVVHGAYPPAHDDVAALHARIAALEAQLDLRKQQAKTAYQGLGSILALSTALLVTHEEDAILSLVVHESLRLFPQASGVLLFLRDAASGQLLLRATSSDDLPSLVTAPGHGLAGRALLAPRSMLLHGPEIEMALDELGDMEKATLQQMLTSWPPSSALIAPLRSAEQRLGALICYGGTQAHMFMPRDLPLVQAMADIAAVALTEASMRETSTLLERDLSDSRHQHAEAQARLDVIQAQLIQSAKLAAVGELAASVAHEINNPLYAARNSLYLAAEDAAYGTPQREFLEIAQSELARIARTISRMRDFYRPTTGEWEMVDLAGLLLSTQEVVRMHTHNGSITVQTELDPQLPHVCAQPDQIRQVLLNLAINACDAMQQSGTLTLTAHPLPVEGTSPAQVKVGISDTGSGIAPEHMAHIFEPFYTTKTHGTGLGLAISSHIIRQHGGTLTVESTPGKGTTFTMVLPQAQP